MHHPKILDQVSQVEKGKQLKNKKKYTKHEINVMVGKKVKKVLKKKYVICTDELPAFEKMSVSDSEPESLDSSSSKEGEV